MKKNNNEQLARIYKLQNSIGRLLISTKLDAARYIQVLQALVQQNIIQVGDECTTTTTESTSVSLEACQQKFPDVPLLQESPEVTLLNTLGIPFFSVEDTERGFSVVFNNEEKQLIHQQRNQIAHKLVKSLLTNDLNIGHFIEKKAYVVVYPKDISLVDMIQRFPKLLVQEPILNEIPSIMTEPFATTQIKPGVGLHFGLGSFPGYQYTDQSELSRDYGSDVDINFTPATAVDEVSALIVRMTKIKNYPDSYGCIFRGKDHLHIPTTEQMAGAITISARLDRTIGIDICLDEAGYRGISVNYRPN
jgi:hypothetical protein